MKSVKLLSDNGDAFFIPLAAARLSEVLGSEIECQNDDENSDSDGGVGLESHETNDSCMTSTIAANRVSSIVLRKVADFLTYYVTEEEMTNFEPPFATENICDIVQEWYAEFITVNVDRVLLLDLISVANFLVG